MLRCDWKIRRELIKTGCLLKDDTHSELAAQVLARVPLIDMDGVQDSMVQSMYDKTPDWSFVPIFEEYAIYKFKSGVHFVGMLSRNGRGMPMVAGSEYPLAFTSMTLDKDKIKGVTAAWDRDSLVIDDTFTKDQADHIKLMAAIFLIATQYIVEGTGDYLAESAPILTPKQRVASDKDARKKPWLRQDLSSYVLIKQKDFAPPPVVERSQAGATPTHTKRAHQRRGHMRRLFGETVDGAREIRKRVFVRPSWIGPTSWESGGRMYKIVPPKAAAGAK